MSSSSSDRHDAWTCICSCATAHRGSQPGKPAHIPLGALQRIFAPDIESTRLFKARLKEDLKAILKVYPRFRIEIKGDMMTLWKSPSPIPPKTILSTAKIIR